MSPNSATISRRTVRAVLAAGLACLISGLVVVFATLLPSASADHDDPLLIVKDDDHPGGNATCEEFGLVPLFPKVEGAVSVNNAFVSATVSEDGKTIDVVAKDGFVVTAVIVKGSDASHVYFVAPFHDMTAPPLKPGTDRFPGISHYIVCGFEGDETTPGDGETTPGDGETTPGDGETTPGDGETTPGDGETTPGDGETTPGDGETTPGDGETTPGNGEMTSPGKATTPPGQDLPKTGSGNGWLAALGAGLLLGGTGLVLAGRQAGRHQA